VFIERFNVAAEAEHDWRAFVTATLAPLVSKEAKQAGGCYRALPHYLDTPTTWAEENEYLERVYQYVNLYEIDATSPAVLAAVAASEAADARWPGALPHTEAVKGIRVAYEKFGGLLGEGARPERFYVTRYNLPIPRRAEWERNYAGNHLLDCENATGRPGLGRAACYRITGVPRYVNWWGPSWSYQYFNIYEVLNDEGVESALLDRKKVYAGKGQGEAVPSANSWIRGTRTVYERLAEP
jgi:hypothetical protein